MLIVRHKITDIQCNQLTDTSVFRWNELVMGWTLTDVSSLRIDAVAVLAGLRVFTFVDVGTVTARLVQLESLVADATEHAVDILALTENAQVAEHQALVDVCIKQTNTHQLIYSSQRRSLIDYLLLWTSQIHSFLTFLRKKRRGLSRNKRSHWLIIAHKLFAEAQLTKV